MIMLTIAATSLCYFTHYDVSQRNNLAVVLDGGGDIFLPVCFFVKLEVYLISTDIHALNNSDVMQGTKESCVSSGE